MYLGRTCHHTTQVALRTAEKQFAGEGGDGKADLGDVRRSLNGLRKRLLSSPHQQQHHEIFQSSMAGPASPSRLESPDSGTAEMTAGIQSGLVRMFEGDGISKYDGHTVHFMFSNRT